MGNTGTQAMRHQLLGCCSSSHVKDQGIFWHRNLLHVCHYSDEKRSLSKCWALHTISFLFKVMSHYPLSHSQWEKRLFYSKKTWGVEKCECLKFMPARKNTVALLSWQSSLAADLKGLMLVSHKRTVQFFHKIFPSFSFFFFGNQIIITNEQLQINL